MRRYCFMRTEEEEELVSPTPSPGEGWFRREAELQLSQQAPPPSLSQHLEPQRPHAPPSSSSCSSITAAAAACPPSSGGRPRCRAAAVGEREGEVRLLA